MHQRQLTDSKGYTDGTVTGAVYTDDANHMDLIGKFYGMFPYFNPLHATLHPATRQMDAEVVQMVLDLYKGPEGACGAFTTGESPPQYPALPPASWHPLTVLDTSRRKAPRRCSCKPAPAGTAA